MYLYPEVEFGDIQKTTAFHVSGHVLTGVVFLDFRSESQYSLQSSDPIPLEYVEVCHQSPEPKPYNSLSPHVCMMAHTCICHVILPNLVLHMAFSDGVHLEKLGSPF